MDRRQNETSSGSTGGFAEALRRFRESRGLSQSRLAAAAGYDHSYVSRLESGSRMPTRDAVINIATALGADAGERDRLLAAAGFMPVDIENLLAEEPIVGEVLGLLQDRAVPRDVREDLRSSIAMAVRQAQRAAPQFQAPNVAEAHANSVAAD